MLSVLIGYLLTGFISCEKNENSPPSSTDIEIGIGEEKTLNVIDGEIADIKVKFTSVQEGRCPCEECLTCYGGYVYAYFSFQLSNSKPDTLKLHRIGCIPAGGLKFGDPNMDTKMIGGLTIGLSNITEYTKSTAPTRYISQLIVSKK